MLRKLARTLRDFFAKYCQPYQEQIVLKLIMGTSSLALKVGEVVQLAPVNGTCGPISLSGNARPVFEYLVFEKKIMEFIKVRVEVSSPSRIDYLAQISSTTAPERHGEVVEFKAAYKKPFEMLALHLFEYFGLYKNQDEKFSFNQGFMQGRETAAEIFEQSLKDEKLQGLPVPIAMITVKQRLLQVN